MLLLSAITATFILAGVVKGVTGMGLPTVAMGLLSVLISPLAAASLLIVPSLVTNVWQLMAGPNFDPLLRRLWPMMLAVIVGTVAGLSLLTSGHTTLAMSALGGTLVLYSTYTLFARQFRVSTTLEPWLSPLIGTATGLITGGTGIFVVPAVPYIQMLGLEKDDLVQALGLSFTTSTIALAVGLAMARCHGYRQPRHIGVGDRSSARRHVGRPDHPKPRESVNIPTMVPALSAALRRRDVLEAVSVSATILKAVS